MKKTSGRRKAFLAVAVALTTVIVILLVGIPMMFQEPKPQGDHGPPESTLGIRVNQTSPGSWTITITGGSYKASIVHLTVMNAMSGLETVNKVVSKLAQARNDPDAVFSDHNANSKLDTGDKILLMSSGGHVATGHTVRFLQNNHIIGTINGLP
jgi:hypothetical protein